MELFTEDVIYRDNQICARHEGRVLARVVCDSVAPDENSTRLTTLEVVLPRIVLAEFNTHRNMSRNSASSRAIPIEKMLKRVKEDPYIPETWGKNQKGMQAEEALTGAVATMIECGQKPPQSSLRTEQASIRLTPYEKAWLSQRATDLGFKGVSDFIRNRIISSLS